MSVKLLVLPILLLSAGCMNFDAINQLPQEGYRVSSGNELKQRLKGGVTIYVLDKHSAPGATIANHYSADHTMVSQYMSRDWSSAGTWSIEDGTLCHAWKKWGKHCFLVFTKQGAVTNHVHAKYGFINFTEVKVVSGNPENL